MVDMVNKNNKENKEIIKETPKYQKATFRIDDVETDNAIINVNGWRMRVDIILNKDTNLKDLIGKTIEVEYVGDIEHPTKNTPKFNIIRL